MDRDTDREIDLHALAPSMFHAAMISVDEPLPHQTITQIECDISYSEVGCSAEVLSCALRVSCTPKMMDTLCLHRVTDLSDHELRVLESKARPRPATLLMHANFTLKEPLWKLSERTI